MIFTYCISSVVIACMTILIFMVYGKSFSAIKDVQNKLDQIKGGLGFNVKEELEKIKNKCMAITNENKEDIIKELENISEKLDKKKNDDDVKYVRKNLSSLNNVIDTEDLLMFGRYSTVIISVFSFVIIAVLICLILSRS